VADTFNDSFRRVAPWVAYPLLLLLVFFVSVFRRWPVPASPESSIDSGLLLCSGHRWYGSHSIGCVRQSRGWIGTRLVTHKRFIRLSSIPQRGAEFCGYISDRSGNSAIAFAVIMRTSRHILVSVAVLLLVGLILMNPKFRTGPKVRPVFVDQPQHWVVAIQPNVPMRHIDDSAMRQLLDRHLILSAQGFASVRLIVGTRDFLSGQSRR